MEWTERARAKLDQLAQLQDGFCTDGVAPDAQAVAQARAVLEDLIRRNVKPRRIAPICDGGIVFVFSAEQHLPRITVNNQKQEHRA